MAGAERLWGKERQKIGNSQQVGSLYSNDNASDDNILTSHFDLIVPRRGQL